MSSYCKMLFVICNDFGNYIMTHFHMKQHTYRLFQQRCLVAFLQEKCYSLSENHRILENRSTVKAAQLLKVLQVTF